MITFKLKLGSKDVELTVAQAKELYSQLDQLFGKPVPQPTLHYPPGVREHVPGPREFDGTGDPFPGLPYKVTCDAAADAVVRREFIKAHGITP